MTTITRGLAHPAEPVSLIREIDHRILGIGARPSMRDDPTRVVVAGKFSARVEVAEPCTVAVVCLEQPVDAEIRESSDLVASEYFMSLS